MTADGELIRLELENQIFSNRALLTADPAVSDRYGLAAADVAGLPCSSCRVWDSPLFNRTMGAGVLGLLDASALAAIHAEYARRGRSVHVEVYDGITPPEILRVLESGGLVPTDGGLAAHVLETDREPSVTAPAPGVTVERCAQSGFAEFASIVRSGFEAPGELGTFFEEATRVALERLPAEQAVAFLARVDGEPAGTGMLLLTDRVAGLYSGSVMPAFRGRGIQHQLIAARVREGLRLGRRIFVSQTEGDNASAHNLRDAGFRTLYRAHWWAPAPTT